TSRIVDHDGSVADHRGQVLMMDGVNAGASTDAYVTEIPCSLMPNDAVDILALGRRNGERIAPDLGFAAGVEKRCVERAHSVVTQWLSFHFRRKPPSSCYALQRLRRRAKQSHRPHFRRRRRTFCPEYRAQCAPGQANKAFPG